MHQRTKSRIDALLIPDDRPILAIDADEVILLFAQDFDAWLRPRDVWFDYNLYDYSVALKDRDGRSLGFETADALVQRFNIEGTRHHKPAPGAVEALKVLQASYTIIVLTNVPMSCWEDREANFADLGLDLPIIANVGPKGPALSYIQSRSPAATLFVDDNPNQIASAAQYAPNVTRIHFTGCDRLRPTLPHAKQAQHRPQSWAELTDLLTSGF